MHLKMKQMFDESSFSENVDMHCSLFEHSFEVIVGDRIILVVMANANDEVYFQLSKVVDNIDDYVVLEIIRLDKSSSYYYGKALNAVYEKFKKCEDDGKKMLLCHQLESIEDINIVNSALNAERRVKYIDFEGVEKIVLYV